MQALGEVALVQIEYEVKPGKIVKVLSLDETGEIEKSWMSVFAKNKQGFNTSAFKWHIFSGGGYPSVNGEEARAEYFRQSAATFVVLPNEKGCAVITDRLPEFCNLSDYYVFPPNMAWVMAFTHEEGWLGPYFAKHPKYTMLCEENTRLIEKERKKAEAKQKGWM